MPARYSIREQHLLSRSPEYNVWSAMIDRCENPNATSYHRYGGRGISVCARWRNSFLRFVADMGARPGFGHSIDRINGDGNYKPGNCRWATRKEQARNRKTSRFVEFRGERRCLATLCEELGVDYRRTWQRISRWGWSVEESISRSVFIGRPRKPSA